MSDQLRRHLRADVQAGRWTPTAELCRKYGCSRHLVSKIRDELRSAEALPYKGTIRCAAVVLLALLAWAAPALAGPSWPPPPLPVPPPPPADAWHATIAERPAPSFWWADGIVGALAVEVAGGPGAEGGIACEDDGFGTLRCAVYAQGDWRRVTVVGLNGSVSIAAEPWRVALPMVGRAGQ